MLRRVSWEITIEEMGFSSQSTGLNREGGGWVERTLEDAEAGSRFGRKFAEDHSGGRRRSTIGLV